MSKNESPATKLPLAVDVDGSLLKTDMLIECFWAALGRHPWLCFLAVLTLIFNRPALKQRLAVLAELDVTELPKRQSVAILMREAATAERVVVLASGSDARLVRKLSDHFELTEPPLASDGRTNMTGAQKAKALKARYGAAGYQYVGDSTADIPVWQAGKGGYVVAAGARLRKRVAAAGLKLTPVGRANSASALFLALRPHQWIKNILLLLPIIAAHRTDLAGFAATFWGIAVFSAAASSIYIVNDLLDLSADRRHETKKNRPFAAGQASLQSGMLTAAVLVLFALTGAALHSWQLAAIIAFYIVLSQSYSLGLKRLRWVDITTLSALYSLRVIAGAIAASVPMSGWLGAFVFAVFLSLGAVKRLIELGKAKDDLPLPGRGYARNDRADMRNIGITAAVGAVVVYLLYTYSEIASILYQDLWEIRLAAIPVALWLGRMLYRGWQARMDYDPVVFALRDPIGLALVAIGGGLLVHAVG